MNQKVVSFLEDFDLQKFEDLKNQITEKTIRLEEKEGILNKLLDTHNDIIKKEKLLEDHEYDPDCRYCCENEFVKDAHIPAK